MLNATLKGICGLLSQDDPDLQLAAIRVLGAIGTRESGVHKALGELLTTTENPVVFGAILDVAEQTPHEGTLRYLVQILERDSGRDEQVLNAIAKIGGKAVGILKRQFERSSSPTKQKIVAVLPRIRTPQAHSFLVECAFDSDSELVRQTVHALREEVNNYAPKEKGDLYQKLVNGLKDKRNARDDAALSALIISLGILGEMRAKEKLLPYVDRHWPTQIRRHALMSLARLEYTGASHANVFKKLWPVLEESDYEGLVRHAVAVLSRIKPRRADNARIQKLLESKHRGVQVYALEAISQLDSITNAEHALHFLGHSDPELRDAAAGALRQMRSAVTVILRHLDDVADRVRAFEMVKILESHDKRIKPDQAREMIKHMLSLYEAGDEHYQLYRIALRHLRGDVLQSELVTIAERARKKKDWERVRDTLKLLDNTEQLTPEIRFQLAVAKLKTSEKDRSRTFRLADYCLEHIAKLLEDDPKGFRRRLLAEKALDADDYLYVGYHFSERLNQERRFGADLLRHVIKKWSRRQAAKDAQEKLRVEGH